MKLNLTIIVTFFFIMFSAKAQDLYPVIKIDDAHNHIAPGANKEVQYTVKGGKGITVDATDFDFTILKKYLEGNLPDKIFIVNESGTFYTDFNPTGQTTLNKTTLKTFIGNSTFLRFQSGDTPIIAIGTVKMNGKQPKMAQVWATSLVVK